MEEIVSSCQYLLDNFPAAQLTQNYLDSRLSKEIQQLFQFGYFPPNNNLSALTNLIEPQLLKDHKLLYQKDIEDSLCPRTINFSYFEDYPLVLPFKNVYGKSVALVGRTLLSEEERHSKKISKYKNTIFKKGNHLFGLFENKLSILQKDSVFIVEGQFDVIKAVEKGLTNIVALGNSNMTVNQFALILRYTNNIYLLLDNDEAGEKGRNKIIEKFGNKANIRNLYLPPNFKDIDDFLSTNSVDDLPDDFKIAL